MIVVVIATFIAAAAAAANASHAATTAVIGVAVVQYITGGLEISLTVAIDFTASNGDPSSKASLHHIDPAGHHNIYQQAIHAVCSVLEPYDSDHMYPVYGFGAKVKEENGEYGKVQHCFPVYAGGLEVKGIDGIMQVTSLPSRINCNYERCYNYLLSM